jgi:UDP-glucuronate 4-epimerase
MASPKFLVTGGAGFIGSHVVESLLADGARVTIIDDFNDYYDPAIKHRNVSGFLNDVELVRGDIRDPALVERLFARGKFDSVIHLAARAGVRPSILDPKSYVTTNIDGTFNLLDSCRHNEVKRFAFASSSSVYGINKKVPFAEDDAIPRTISPYAATKLACEQICSNYSYLFGMRVTCLRFFTVYGPRQRPDLAIAKFFAAIRNDQPIERYGDGGTRRDYTFIADIVAGVRAAADYDDADFEIFNLGGSRTTGLAELIAALEELAGKKAIIVQKPEQPGDVPQTFADVHKAKRLLGWEPRTPLAEGLAKYAEWALRQ